jgi:hypothetical protein
MISADVLLVLGDVPRHAIGACCVTSVMHQLKLELGFLRYSGEGNGSSSWQLNRSWRWSSRQVQMRSVLNLPSQGWHLLSVCLSARVDALRPETNLRKPSSKPQEQVCNYSSILKQLFPRREIGDQTNNSKTTHRISPLLIAPLEILSTTISFQSPVARGRPSIRSHLRVPIPAACQYSMSRSEHHSDSSTQV